MKRQIKLLNLGHRLSMTNKFTNRKILKMLKLDTNDKKKLKFDVQIAGIDSNLLEGALRLVIEGVEYGFPATFTSNSIEISLPALSSVIKELKEDTIAHARLDVYGNGYYINPWKEEILVKNSVQVRAQFKEENKPVFESRMPEISCSVSLEEITETEYPREQVSASAGIGSGAYETPHGSKDDMVRDAIPLKDKKNKFKEKEYDEDRINARTNAVLQKVKDKLSKMKILEKSVEEDEDEQPIPVKKKVKKIKEAKKEIKQEAPIITEVSSKNDIYKYMASKGMKNEKIQKMLVERAEDLSNSDDLQSIFETIQKMITNNKM